jgi:hypothetical protein
MYLFRRQNHQVWLLSIKDRNAFEVSGCLAMIAACTQQSWGSLGEQNWAILSSLLHMVVSCPASHGTVLWTARH